LLCGGLAAQNTWKSPKQGWLYVLDGGGFSRNEAHILLVDPSNESVEGRITVGQAPEFTISSDGSKIFVVSGSVDQGEVTVYDAQSGQRIASTNIQFRVLYTAWSSSATVAVSRDGRWLFVETMRTIAEGVDEYAVLRFDVGGGAIKPAGRASLPECGLADLIPIGDGKFELLVHCPFSNATRQIRFDTNGSVAIYADLELPSRPYNPASGLREHRPLNTVAVLYRGGGDLTVLTGSNEVCHFSMQNGTGPCSSLPARMQGRWIPARPWPHSPDGKLIYVGSGPTISRSQGMASSIEVIELETMKLLSSIDVSTPFWQIAVSPRGETLYATNPVTHTILEIDAIARKAVKEISIPGHPAAIIPVT